MSLIREVQICLQLYGTKSYHISQLRIVSKPAELACSAVSVFLPFWVAAAVWEAFTWDHRCDDETPPAWTENSLKLLWLTTVHSGGCNSRQEHYADQARGTKATVAVRWDFFHAASRPKCGWPPLPPWNSHPACSQRMLYWNVIWSAYFDLFWELRSKPIGALSASSSQVWVLCFKVRGELDKAVPSLACYTP